ncbi:MULTISPECIES: ScbR family autoregulator-binding transcription factor [Gordonia]|uniref:Putative TetR family transcriptional regulator n=1 Tax=Gordonia sihwensis NBRC 108236 TaxID=1223544 RepID=L7LMU0_9ACTN|nr:MULTISPECIES: ScbR family autoregulator-binding transcription factor [Gordonia]AUH67239.1 TetR family transcriptional regulator [Gordonia sp. YC-JH1]GAC62036.1 putative TetR family transcriptional regulator [Gordonia sihwensis NBRC 108236]
MAQQARAVETRRQIVVAAANLFSRVGYERARLNDIVGESGLTRGAIYFHFQSKDDLAAIVVDEFQATSMRAVGTIAQTDTYGMRQLVMLCREMGRLLVDDPVVRAGIRLIIELHSGEAPIPVYLAWIEAIKYFVTKAVEDGDVPPDTDAEEAAVFVTESFVGAHVLSYAVSGHDDLPARIDRLADYLVTALMPDERIAARSDLLGARWTPQTEPGA